jgi:hypothetical protein
VTDPKPFRVEVTVDASRDAVWRALAEPDLIRQWFGWDYEGLDAEIQYIFVDHAEPHPPDRIDFPDETGIRQTIELAEDGPRTVVRVVKPAPLDSATRDDVYDGEEEGWRWFFEQLRFLLERGPTGRRRTVYLTGTVPGRRAVDVVDSAAPKELWHGSRYLRMVVDRAGHLVVVSAQRPLDDPEPSPAGIAVSTFGLDDAAFAAVAGEWAGRWRPVAPDATVTT